MRWSSKKLVWVLTSLTVAATFGAVAGQSSAGERRELTLGTAASEVAALAKSYPDGVPASEVRALMFRLSKALHALPPQTPTCGPNQPPLGCLPPYTPPSKLHIEAPPAIGLMRTVLQEARLDSTLLPVSRLKAVADSLRELSTKP